MKKVILSLLILVSAGCIFATEFKAPANYETAPPKYFMSGYFPAGTYLSVSDIAALKTGEYSADNKYYDNASEFKAVKKINKHIYQVEISDGIDIGGMIGGLFSKADFAAPIYYVCFPADLPRKFNIKNYEFPFDKKNPLLIYYVINNSNATLTDEEKEKTPLYICYFKYLGFVKYGYKRYPF